MLKLKLQYFGHLMRRTDSFEKTLMLGKIEGRRRRWRQRMRWLDGITDSMDMGLGGLLGIGDGQRGLACCGSWGRKEWTQLSYWTELNCAKFPLCSTSGNSCKVSMTLTRTSCLLFCTFCHQQRTSTCYNIYSSPNLMRKVSWYPCYRFQE